MNIFHRVGMNLYRASNINDMVGLPGEPAFCLQWIPQTMDSTEFPPAVYHQGTIPMFLSAIAG